MRYAAEKKKKIENEELTESKEVCLLNKAATFCHLSHLMCYIVCNVTDLFHPSGMQLLINPHVDLRHRMRRKDGKHFWVELIPASVAKFNLNFRIEFTLSLFAAPILAHLAFEASNVFIIYHTKLFVCAPLKAFMGKKGRLFGVTSIVRRGKSCETDWKTLCCVVAFSRLVVITKTFF